MVVIEKMELLKTWLVKRLSPMCDADPNALAKYVVALIKKDKSDEDLRKLCVDQLEVFLQKETDLFVSDLFETLKTKSYAEDSTESLQNSGSLQEQIPILAPGKDDGRKEVRRRIQRPSPIRHRSRSPYERRRRRDDRSRRSRSPVRDRRRDRRYRSHSGSPKKSRLSPKRKSPRRSRSPYNRRRRRTRSLSSSRSSTRSPDSSHQKQTPSSTDDRQKKRCWDYDQKGFCIQGDNCPYDHGSDPVVVEDSAISSSTNQAVPPVIVPVTAPPPIMPPITKVAPPLLIPPFLPPPPIGFPPPPGIRPPGMAPPGLRPPIPPPIPPPQNMRVPPPKILPPPRNIVPPPGYNPEAPGLGFEFRKQNLTNLVPISAKGEFPSDSLSRKRIVQLENNEQDGPVIKRTVYNNSSDEPTTQIGMLPNNFATNTKLIIKKIPPMLNNITKLNEHFSKFGAINNIQVKFENDPQCALVEFAHVNSARAAKRDTEAVFNNRFIVVHWYNGQAQNNGRLPKSQMRTSVKDRLGKLPMPSQLKYTAPGRDTKTPVQKESVAAGGTIFRTISNATANVTPAPKTPELPTPKANLEMKAKVQQAQKSAKEKLLARQQLVMQKKLELQRGKQSLLQKQMQQQKAFLNMIKTTKNMPAAEKLKLLESLKTLTGSIDRLRTSIKGEDGGNTYQVKEKAKQTQKELLDAELDLYNASTTGENTLNLKRKLSQLKMEASSLGLVTGYKGTWGPYRGRGRGRGASFTQRPKAPRVFSATANLDRRPRELRITGFHEDEKDEVVSHLATFGEIEHFTFNDDGITCTVKYQTRAQAELAAVNSPTFKNRRLVVVWSSGGPPPPPPPVAEAPMPATAEEVEESVDALVVPPLDEAADETDLHDDDDDEDDDDVSVHIGDVNVNYPAESLEEEEDFEENDEELDEDALLAADYDEDEDHIADDDYEDEEIRSWRH